MGVVAIQLVNQLNLVSVDFRTRNIKIKIVSSNLQIQKTFVTICPELNLDIYLIMGRNKQMRFKM